MPLFLSDEEFERCSHDASLVAEKADSFIKDLYRQLETVKAQTDAASITAEQTCSLLEQKYISLSSDFAKLESQNAELNKTLEQRISELAEVQSEKHQLYLKAIGRDGDVERLSIEVSELHKSNRQLLELVEQKDLEISEKNATMKTYLDKIVNQTDNGALREARLHDIEAEMARSHAALARVSQEKELIERHNVWLNDELTAKVGSLIELRRSHTELEADMSAKLANVQREFDECSRSLKWNKERVRELEINLTSMQEELCSFKDGAAANEERYSAEISTVTKLVELYKESSEEWSRKAGELEGVIKALETHLSQVENDYKEKLEKEVAARKDLEKEAKNLKEKLEKCEAEIENSRKANELSLLPLSSFAEERLLCGTEVDEMNEDNRMIIPRIPAGVSGTALAASLLRDGWSLAKMYEKYQEAVDALRHERLGRKQSQAVLERVLFEIEEKAEVILDERAEHERMVEAYSVMNQKLQQSLSEQVNLESTVRELKVPDLHNTGFRDLLFFSGYVHPLLLQADLRRHDREYGMAQKEIVDLQKQVTVLLKECRDIQLRCGSISQNNPDDYTTNTAIEMNYESDAEKVISERLLTFKDINGLVEQNVQLRSLVRSLSDQNEKRDAELKEKFEMELRKQTDEAASKVEAVLKRAEEQGHMIESLHSSVAMYKRLYEEELKLQNSHSHSAEAVPEHGRKDLMLLLEGSQEASKKAHEQASERAKHLEEELAKSRSEIISMRLERDKLAMEANFARDRLDSFMKEFEHQRDELSGFKARNVEFSKLIIDHQRKLRESSDSLLASEELSRKLTMEVSILKHEKEMLLNSENRASEEVRRLSERVHRLQSSLDTIQSAEEVREEARTMERRKQEEYLKRVEREWAEAKKELQEERDNVRSLTLDREQTIKNAMRQVEEIGKQLADALRAVAAAEARAAVAEVSLYFETFLDASNLNRNLQQVAVDFLKAKEEMEKLKEEAQANKEHMLQYKNIAQVNESALKQMESAHEKFKNEADKLKKSLEAEIVSLRERISELENDCILKSKEAASAVTGKEEALDSALAEITNLKEDISIRTSKMMAMEIQLSSLKEDLGKENERWRTAQNNYERQVILQSETIQELTKTSQALALLQEEASELRKLADAQKSEIGILKSTWETEKSVLEQSKNESVRKYNEINEQNKILHNHLEALHIKLAERERNYAGISSGSTVSDQHGDLDLQNVVNYLRRSKEIAETEISLLKQEKLRLQSQLETALKASETAQSLLHSERANSRASIFTDEEFKSLQIQVREINLLRESNMQLREENKHNFEECQKLREIAQKARIETENLQALLREKQITVDGCQKEIEMQKIDRGNLENRIKELLEKGKNIDLEDYERVKDDFQQMQVKLLEKEAEVEETKKLVSEKQDTISRLEQELANCRLELIEREKRINDTLQTEASLKLEVEKHKRVIAHFKKRIEILTKERDELSKEKQSLLKQLEDSKQGKRPVGDSSNDQAIKEKDTRIQILETTLNREREEVKKEKAKRAKNEKAVVDLLKNVNQEKKKLVDELERHKQAREHLLENTGVSASQLPSENVLDDQMASYLLAVDNLEEGKNSILSESSAGDAPSVTASVRQVHPQAVSTQSAMTGAPSQSKTTDEREKRSSFPKPNAEARKVGRKLVRPRLGRPEESTGDVEMCEVEGSPNTEGKVGASHDSEPQADLGLPTTQPLVRKRLASSLASELRDEAYIQQETGSNVLKKSKGSDSAIENSEGQPAVPPEILDTAPTVDEPLDASADLPLPGAANEEAIDAEKDEVDTTKEPVEESKEPLIDGESQSELNSVSEELLDNKARETAEDIDERMRDGEEQDPQLQPTLDVENDREEGELPSDLSEQQDGGDISIEPVENLPEPVLVPGIDEEAAVSTMAEVVAEAASPEILIDEKTEMGEMMEEIAEDSDKSNSGTDLGGTLDTEQSPKAAFGAGGENSSSPSSNRAEPKNSNLNALPETDEGGKEGLQGGAGSSGTPTTINLTERARQRAMLRQAGVVNPPLTRGRGRAVTGALKKEGATARGRGGRGARGGRGGRGQGSDDKGQSQSGVARMVKASPPIREVLSSSVARVPSKVLLM
ncbi:Tetratricopeptide [Macleaya cordata]|uniref:Tetratricopeptide n=1 Tax=Macleaya cordata TaxID=56857 RepID=A0A200QXL4_MACCD|nr:Tetratricopeptide [Macleaya cordata]